MSDWTRAPAAGGWPAWLRLAAREYRQAFRVGARGVPGGRDLLWLTVLVGLVLLVSAILLTIRNGLLDRFADSLLGKLDGHGIPLWVMSNPERMAGIDASIAALVRAAVVGDRAGAVALHPYREIEPGDPILALPDPGIWRTDGIAAPFQGWAVAGDDPLWQWALAHGEPGAPAPDTGSGPGAGAGAEPGGTAALPLTIVLNRALFGAFQGERYRNRLAQIRPQLPAGTDDARAVLWLTVRVNRGSEVMPFRIVWVDSLPALNRVAFLVSRETMDALARASAFPELRYFPEGQGEPVRRVTMLTFVDGDGPVGPADPYEKLASCLGVAAARDGIDVLYRFRTPVPEDRVEPCLVAAGLAGKPGLQLERISGDRLGVGPDRRVLGPCGRLPARDLAPADRTLCSGQGPAAPVAIPGSIPDRTANLYVAARADLLAVRDALLALRLDGERVFYLNPLYQDALQRFAFLTGTLDWLEVPVLLFGSGLVFALLVIQISVLISHRRRSYALLLTHGLSSRQLAALLYAQVLFATLVAAGVVVPVMALVRAGLNHGFAMSAAGLLARDQLGLPQVVLNPALGAAEWLGLGMGVLLLAWAVLTLQLRRLPLAARTSPSDLL